MNRRTVLVGLPAAGLSLPGAGLASARESRVAATYREWRLIFNEVNAEPSNLSRREDELLSAQVFQLADEILDIPSDGSLDLIYKLMAYTLDGTTDPSDGARGYKIYDEAREVIRSALCG